MIGSLLEESKVQLKSKLGKKMKEFNDCVKDKCSKAVKKVKNNKKLMELQAKRFKADTIEQKEKISEEIAKIKDVCDLWLCIKINNCKELDINIMEISVKLWDKYYRTTAFSNNKIALKQLDDLKELLNKKLTEANYIKARTLYTQLIQIALIYEINLSLDILEIMKDGLSSKQKALVAKLNDLMKKEFSIPTMRKMGIITKKFLKELMKDPKNAKLFIQLTSKV